MKVLFEGVISPAFIAPFHLIMSGKCRFPLNSVLSLLTFRYVNLHSKFDVNISLLWGDK